MVRTRFAPSPTGYLHIGGVRTALFNWLLARQSGGQFILRIDDTDAVRNLESALEPILEGFRWLGLEWDEGPDVGGPHGPYFQSQRGQLYREAAQQLLSSGAAYRDYARSDELQELRTEAEKAGKPFLYDRRWMAEDDAAAERFEAEGRSPVVRLKMPREGDCVIKDAIRGEVRVPWNTEADHVVQRGDGSCLYHLASVVDDQLMGITDVVRAAEHLSNTPRQMFIAQALGYEIPRYAHLPYVAEPGGTAKLSKRKLSKYLKNRDFASLNDHGRAIASRIGLDVEGDTFNPVIVDFYRDIGFLPDAMLNYMLLLGWSLDETTERFDRPAMIKHFSLSRVNKSPASFDPQKLLAFQADRFAELDAATKLPLVRPFLEKAQLVARDAAANARILQVLEAAGPRLRMAGDILQFDEFFVGDDELVFDEKAFEKRLREDEAAAGLLRKLADALGRMTSFSAGEIEQTVKSFVDQEGIKIGQIIHALRVATTGKAAGVGMFEALEILGQASTLRRIERALALAQR